mmetsp:Transcript_29062/g.70891  ORF Transcript_29062/g.70891 Transcript_29062/m.70891 type:complete len:122 (+) Transcript_29062:2272-2637(+)
MPLERVSRPDAVMTMLSACDSQSSETVPDWRVWSIEDDLRRSIPMASCKNRMSPRFGGGFGRDMMGVGQPRRQTRSAGRRRGGVVCGFKKEVVCGLWGRDPSPPLAPPAYTTSQRLLRPLL